MKFSHWCFTFYNMLAPVQKMSIGFLLLREEQTKIKLSYELLIPLTSLGTLFMLRDF